MKEKTGRYKIVLVFLVIYVILMFVIFGEKIFFPKQKTYLLIGSTAKWKFDGQNWTDLKEEEKSEYTWKNYDIFTHEKKIGTYQVTYSENKWYLFEKDRTPVNYEGQILGVRSNKPYQVASYEPMDLEEEDAVYLNEVYQKHGLKENQRYTTGYKVYFDLDGDQEEEILYVITNQFPEDFAPSQLFNFVFVVDQNKIQMVYEETGSFTNMYDYCKIRLDYLIDVDNNKTYEIILNCGYFSTMGNCTSMYEKKGNKYRQIKACHR